MKKVLSTSPYNLVKKFEKLSSREELSQYPVDDPIRVLELVWKNTQIPKDLVDIEIHHQDKVEELINCMKYCQWKAPIFDWHQKGKQWVSGINDLALVAYLQRKITQDEFHHLMSIFNAKRQFENGEPLTITGNTVRKDSGVKKVTVTMPTCQDKVGVIGVSGKGYDEVYKEFLDKLEKYNKKVKKKIDIKKVITKILELPTHLSTFMVVELPKKYIQNQKILSGVIFNPDFYVSQFCFDNFPTVDAYNLGEDHIQIQYLSYAMLNSCFGEFKPLMRFGVPSTESQIPFKQQGRHIVSIIDPRVTCNFVAPHFFEGGPVMTEIHDAHIHVALASQYSKEFVDQIFAIIPKVNSVIKLAMQKRIPDYEIDKMNTYKEMLIDLSMHFASVCNGENYPLKFHMTHLAGHLQLTPWFLDQIFSTNP